MKLVTSNQKKLAEFNRFGLSLEIAPGLDLKEVQGTMDDVIVHKALDAGKDMVVEDTILEIDGQEVVDIRWKIDQLNGNTSTSCRWIVSLGYNDGKMIHVYRGILEGTLVQNHNPDPNSFGFDPFFVPNGQNKTLDELNKMGLKDQFSSRLNAILDLKNNTPIFSVLIQDIKPWTGSYQH